MDGAPRVYLNDCESRKGKSTAVLDLPKRLDVMAVLRSGLLFCAVVLGTAAFVAAQDNEIQERGLRDSIKQISQTVTAIPSLGKMMRSVNMTEIARASTKVAKELSKSLKMDVFAVGKALAAAGAALGSIVFVGGMAGMLATGLGMFRYSPDLYNSGYFSNRVGPAYPSVPSFGDAQALIFQRVQQAQQQYLASQNGQAQRAGAPQQGQAVPQVGVRPGGSQEYYGERDGQTSRSADDIAVSARDARILKETKRPYTDELMPALMDLFKAVSNNIEKVAPEVSKALRR